MIGDGPGVLTADPSGALGVGCVEVRGGRRAAVAVAVDDRVARLEVNRALLAGSCRSAIGRPLASLLIHGLHINMFI